MKKLLLLLLVVVLGATACSKDEIYINVDDDGTECLVNGEPCPDDVNGVVDGDRVTVTFSLNRQEFVIGASTSKGSGYSTRKVGDDNMPHYWPNETMTVTFTHVDPLVDVVTTTINPSVLTLDGNTTPELRFVPGEWSYTATSSDVALDFSNTLPFTLTGSFTAYGQVMSLEFDADTDFSFLSIENDDICGDQVLLSKSDLFTDAHVMASHSDAIITEISTTTPTSIAYSYVKVSTDVTYVALPFDNDLHDGVDDCSTVGVGEVEIDSDYTHYHYAVTVNRGDAISTGSWFDIELKEFAFNEGTFTIGNGTIDFEIAFSADTVDWGVFPTVWNVARLPYRWFHEDYANFFIVPDGNTPIKGVSILLPDSGSVNVAFDTSEGQTVKNAIEIVDLVKSNNTITAEYNGSNSAEHIVVNPSDSSVLVVGDYYILSDGTNAVLTIYDRFSSQHRFKVLSPDDRDVIPNGAAITIFY